MSLLYKKLIEKLPGDADARAVCPLIFSSDPELYDAAEGVTLTMREYIKMLIRSWCFMCLSGIERKEFAGNADIVAVVLRAHILNPTAQLNLHRHDTLDAEEIKAMMKALYRNPDYLPHFAALPAFTLRSRDGGLFLSLYTRS